MSRENQSLDWLEQNANRGAAAAMQGAEKREVKAGSSGSGISASLFDQINGNVPVDPQAAFTNIRTVNETAGGLDAVNALSEMTERAQNAASSTISTANQTDTGIPASVLQRADELLSAVHEFSSITDVLRWDKKMERAGFCLEPITSSQGEYWDVSTTRGTNAVTGLAHDGWYIVVPTPNDPSCFSSDTRYWFDVKDAGDGTELRDVAFAVREPRRGLVIKKQGLIAKVLQPSNQTSPVVESFNFKPEEAVPEYKFVTPAEATAQAEEVAGDVVPFKPPISKMPQTLEIGEGEVYNPREESTFEPVSGWLKDQYKIGENAYASFKCVWCADTVTETPLTEEEIQGYGFAKGREQLTTFKAAEDQAFKALGIDALQVGGIRTSITQGINQARGVVGDFVGQGKGLVREVTGQVRQGSHEQVRESMSEDFLAFAEQLANLLNPMYPNHVLNHMEATEEYAVSQYLNGEAADRRTQGRASAKVGAPIGLRWKKFAEINPGAVRSRNLGATIGGRLGNLKQMSPSGMLVVSVVQTEKPGNRNDIEFFIDQLAIIIPNELIVFELTSKSSATGIRNFAEIERVQNISPFSDAGSLGCQYWLYVGNDTGIFFAEQLKEGFPDIWSKVESLSSEEQSGNAATSGAPNVAASSVHPDHQAPIHNGNQRRQQRAPNNAAIQGHPDWDESSKDDASAETARTVGQILLFLLMFIPKFIFNIIAFPFRMMFNRGGYGGGYNSGYGNGYGSGMNGGMYGNQRPGMFGRNNRYGNNQYGNQYGQTGMYGQQNGMYNQRPGMFGRNRNNQYGQNSTYNNNPYNRNTRRW